MVLVAPSIFGALGALARSVLVYFISFKIVINISNINTIFKILLIVAFTSNTLFKSSNIFLVLRLKLLIKT